MTYKNLVVTQTELITNITINRPTQLNALNKETIEELHIALKNANENKSVGCVILTGSGEKAFVAGADIKEFADFTIEKGKELSALCPTFI